METGINLITKERKRQIEYEGWSADHDDEHTNCELARVAACYAACEDGEALWEDLHIGTMNTDGAHLQRVYPPNWNEFWDKRRKHSRIRRLVIAGALIAAEIDRLARAKRRRDYMVGRK